MVKAIGPAVGSKAQLGYKEEPRWGFPASPPTKFLEITGEGVVSEYTNLVSASLRSDRAVHKQRTGTEVAGGDLNFEVAPEGLGTWLKHALGRRLTKRLDTAFILHYKGADLNQKITLTSTTLSSAGDTGADELSITLTGKTVQQIIAEVHQHASGSWDAYAPWGDGTDGTAGGYYGMANANKLTSGHYLGASDFLDGAGTATTLETFSDMWIGKDEDSNGLAGIFPIYHTYGIYEHTIDAHSTLPEGITCEIGRDVAAFNYYGCRVNTLSLTLNPGEIVTGTINVMAKGASTVGDPTVYGTNTGWLRPVAAIRYAGTSASARITLDIDGSADMFHYDVGAAGSQATTYFFTLRRGFTTHNGYYFDTTTVNGFIEFLEYNSTHFSVVRKGGWGVYDACTSLLAMAQTSLSASSDTLIKMSTSTTVVPLVRGNYIGTDSGQSAPLYIDVTTGGSTDGTAAFKGSWDNASWSTATTITYGTWHNILDENDVDTGFDVMWPDLTHLTSGDTWTVDTFKQANASVSYETEDPYTGFQGAVTLDKGYGAGAVAQGVMGCTFTLNNNLYGDKFELGDRQRAALVAQKRNTEGTISTEFDDLDLYRMFVNGAAGDLTMTLTSDEYINSSTTKYSLQIRFPNIKFSGTTPVAGGEDIIVTDFPFTALYDDTNSIPDLRIVLTNGQAYI